MAADINKVVLVGRLTRDAEQSYTQSGFALLKFSIAVNRNRKQGDQWVEEASFFDVTVFGRQGEAIANYMTKGKQVAVEGQLRQDRWEAQDGSKRSKVTIDANNIQLLGGRDGGSSRWRPGGRFPIRRRMEQPGIFGSPEARTAPDKAAAHEFRGRHPILDDISRR
jgi:single-strand DNA-binding protein